MSEIFMIRHGQASFGEENYDRLSPTGIRQAEIVARRLMEMDAPLDAVYCGTLDRQNNTARAFIDAMRAADRPVSEPIVSDSFDEYDSVAVWRSYIPEMIKEDPVIAEAMERIYTDRKVFQKLFEQVMHRWVSPAPNPPGTPDWQEFTARVNGGLDRVIHTQGAGKRLAVFTSGGPISVTVKRALGLTREKTLEVAWQLMNASITRFKYNDETISLSGFNDVSHLEVEKEAALLTYR